MSETNGSPTPCRSSTSNPLCSPSPVASSREREAAAEEESAEPSLTSQPRTEQVRIRTPRPSPELRVGRVIGVDIGRSWARMAVVERGELELGLGRRGVAAVAQERDHAADLLDDVGLDALGGFIEEQNARPRHQPSSQNL